MIAIGLDSDQTFVHFLAVCDRLGTPVRPINLGAIQDWTIQLDPAARSHVVAAGERIELDPAASYYQRLIDLSPAMGAADDPARWRSLVHALQTWLEVVPARVVNRPGYELHNAAKPLHAYRLRALGFDVPETVVTSDLAAIHRFLADHGPSIVKTLCGVRATAELMTAADFAAFTPQQGPVQLQRYIEGTDVRAHVIGDRVHAEHIRADRPDYRDDDAEREHEPIDLPAALTARLVEATRAIGLAFAGWDFKRDAGGRFWCLEANPMPGYDGYDRRLDLAITRSLIDYLEAGDVD